MTRVEGSEWRCRVPSRTSETGECDVVVLQEAMEKHLRSDHKIRVTKPSEVMERFALVRGAPARGRPPGLGKTEDTTIEMFGKDEFR